jgi:hypothetical protein
LCFRIFLRRFLTTLDMDILLWNAYLIGICPKRQILTAGHFSQPALRLVLRRLDSGFSRTKSTGHAPYSITLSGTLPRKNRRTAELPLAPMTTMS